MSGILDSPGNKKGDSENAFFKERGNNKRGGFGQASASKMNVSTSQYDETYPNGFDSINNPNKHNSKVLLNRYNGMIQGGASQSEMSIIKPFDAHVVINNP